jgi:F-type H+-transporting ATPase subunit alpha
MAVEDQVVVIFAATNGFLDRISVDRVPEFHEALVGRMHAEHAELLAKIAEGDWSEETEQGVRDAVAEFADDFGYDFDEDGGAVDDASSEPATRATAASSDDEDEDEADDETADEPEEEAVTA